MPSPGLLIAKILKPIHSKFIFARRVSVLARYLTELIPVEGLNGLDVGCGSGVLASKILSQRPDLSIEGVDVLLRPQSSRINIKEFDGKNLPYADQSFDFVMIVDVLHHTEDQERLMSECRRVARQFILLKDHACINRWDRVCLGFRDWVGNRAFGVNLPYKYLNAQQWAQLFGRMGLKEEQHKKIVDLYIKPFSFFFPSYLDFVSKLSIHRGEHEN